MAQSVQGLEEYEEQYLVIWESFEVTWSKCIHKKHIV